MTLHPPVSPPPVTRWWTWVQEPRIVSALHLLAYLILAGGAIYALWVPPTSLEGTLGRLSFMSLAGLAATGGVIGSVAVLPGWYWLERVAVFAVILSVAIYSGVLVYLQFNAPGNRVLQLAFVACVGILHMVRWNRIRERPYAASSPAPPPTRTVDHTGH